MPKFSLVPSAGQVLLPGISGVPSLFLDAGPKGFQKYIEFFTARIRNANTREAYARAASQFSRWCEEKKIGLLDLSPFLIAAYVEELGKRKSKPTVKQHLAALRMLLDFLVVSQIIPSNPSSSVRGPKHVVRKGKTPVLTAEEAKELLDAIDATTPAGLRDRAIIGTMIYSFARVGAVLGMNVEDYYQQGKRTWFRLHEKGGKLHDVPSHHKAQEYVDAYLAALGPMAQKGSPLFRRLDRQGNLTSDRLDRREVLGMVKRRAKKVGLPPTICSHSFRATGITCYLSRNGLLEHAQRIAGHASPETTKLYDRTKDAITLDEIERIVL